MSLTRLRQRMEAADSLLCIGLDPLVSASESAAGITALNRTLIDQTHASAAAYKLNTAFYEAYGSAGWRALEETVAYLRDHHPDIIVIADAKRGDIGHTSERYAAAFFDHLNVDAVTLNPYIGYDALVPFLERADRISILLCRTSNPSAGDIQDLTVAGRPLWQHVALAAHERWNTLANCMLVMGATAPDEIAQARQLVPDIPFLVPGVGAQGGDLERSVRDGTAGSPYGVLIHIGRGISAHSSPASAAVRYQMTINAARLR